MAYVPKDWLLDKSNMNKVHSILDNLCIDVITKDSYTKDMAIKELSKLKEKTIIEKLNNGEIHL